MIGDFAPKLIELTDTLLFGDIWKGAHISKRNLSLIAVSAPAGLNRPDQLRLHLEEALENNAVRDELIKAIIHPVFYSGWLNAKRAIMIAEVQILNG